MSELVLASGLAPQLLPIVVDGRASIADILRQVGFAEHDFHRLSVTIADHFVPADRWHRVRPKPAAELMMKVNVRPLGGDNGILPVVLGVLLVAGAIAISGGALAFTVGGALDIGLGGGTLLFGAGSFEASLAAAAVLSLGQMGLNALFPSSVKSKNDKVAEMGSAGARQNVLNPGDYLPRPIGKTKVWPPQVTRPIRFFDGRDEIVEALYAVAGRNVLDDVRIGGVPIADVQGVTAQVIDWNSMGEQQTLLQQYGAAKAIGRPLQWYSINKDSGSEALTDQAFPEKAAPAWDTFSFPDADEMRLRLAWTEGLYKRNDDDTVVYQPMRFRIRPRGATSWINLPEIWFANNEQASSYKKDIIIRRGAQTPVPAPKNPMKTARFKFARTPGQGRLPLLADGTSNGTAASMGTSRFCVVTGGTPAAPIATGYPTVTGAPANGTVWYLRVLEETAAGTISLIVDGLAFNVSVGSTLNQTTIYQMTYNSAGSQFGSVTAIAANTFVGLLYEPKTDAWQAHDDFTSVSMASTPDYQLVTADQNVAVLEEGVAFWLSEAVLPHGPVELQAIAGGAIASGSIDFNKYGMEHFTYGKWSTFDFFGYASDPGSSTKFGPWKIYQMNGPVGVNELVAITRSPPTIGVSKANASLIAVRGRNVQVADVTAIATSVVYDRATGEWLATDRPSKLSEAIARGEATHRPVSAEIDETAYDAWFASDELNGFRVGFETAGGRWDDTQKILASAGRAGFSLARKFRPYFDRDRSAEYATMAFTPANSRYLGLSRSWPAIRTDALRVTWREETDDYLERSKIIYAAGVDQASYRGLEDVTYPDLTAEALVDMRASYDLAVRRYRGTRLLLETDHAIEAVEKGDLVVAIYDVLAERDATHDVNERAPNQSAYIKSVTRNISDQVTAIEVSRPVYVEPSSTDFFALTNVFTSPNVMAIGDPYIGLVTVGRVDPDDEDEQAGYVLQLALDVAAAGATTTIGIVPSTIPHSDQIEAGQIFAVGRAKRLRRRGIVESIMPQGRTFQLTLVPEAPEIFA